MSTKNRQLGAQHKAAFRQRRKAGLQPVAKPWDWISAADVKELALKAYYVATHGMVEDVHAGQLSDQELRELFAGNLADLMRDLVMAQAVLKGGCWPVESDTPPYQDYPRIAAVMCADLPQTWRPQYPLFKSQTGQEVHP